jgi:hypothetical protein
MSFEISDHSQIPYFRLRTTLPIQFYGSEKLLTHSEFLPVYLQVASTFVVGLPSNSTERGEICMSSSAL